MLYMLIVISVLIDSISGNEQIIPENSLGKDSCTLWAHAIPLENTRLAGELASREANVAISECFRACSRSTNCLSFNFKSDGGICELLSTYRCADVYPLEGATGFRYYDMACQQDRVVSQRLLKSKDCLQNGKCFYDCEYPEKSSRFKVCQSNDNCSAANSECKDKICQCSSGYMFQENHPDVCVEDSGNKGTDFVVGFLYNTVLPSSQIAIYVSNGNDAPASVTLYSVSGVLGTYAVSPRSTLDISLDPFYFVSQTVGLDTKGIRVVSDVPVSVYLTHGRVYTMDAVLAVPTNLLVKEYMTLSWYSPSNNYPFKSEFVVIATKSGTNVNVQLSSFSGYTMTFEGVVYQPGDNISFTLNELESAFFYCDYCDLSTSVVKSSKPVAVFNGNGQTKVGGTGGADHLLEQATSIRTWGTRFFLFGLVDQLSGPFVRILTSRPNTTVNFHDGNLNKAVFIGGQYTVYTLTMDREYSGELISDKPVLVAIFYTGCGGIKLCDPAMMYVPPVNQYTKPPFYFKTPTLQSPMSCVLVVTEDRYIYDVQIDGKLVTAFNFQKQPKALHMTYSMVQVCNLMYGGHVISHNNTNAKVLALAVGVNNFLSYYVILGRQYANLH